MIKISIVLVPFPFDDFYKATIDANAGLKVSSLEEHNFDRKVFEQVNCTIYNSPTCLITTT